MAPVRNGFVDALARISDTCRVIHDATELLTYESDALVHLRQTPLAVVLPESAADVQAVVKLCHRERVPFVARGHGTGLSGGALPVAGGIVIALSRLNRVLDIDIPNLRITVEPGVTNLDVTRYVAPFGCYFAPDPSSQRACSIGGNIAENSGGAHCFKYGFTVHHVTGVEFVLPDGELIQVGGGALDAPGFDLLAAIVGSEGTLGIVTKATLRLLRRAEETVVLLAAFESTDHAGDAVSALIARGIVPSAIEMMDRLTIQASEASVHAGFPDAAAVLIVEVDGPRSEVEALHGAVEDVCRAACAQSVTVARTPEDRERIWKGRKAAFAAMGRVSPNYYVQDGVIPRTTLPEVLRKIGALEARSGLRIGNVFHAGDGNLHPLICYDESVPGQAALAEDVAAEILTYCLDAGGSITGEHGVGADKAAHMPRMFSPSSIEAMQLVRTSFDPAGLCNPGKVFPTPRLCGEVPGPYRQHPIERDGLGERL